MKELIRKILKEEKMNPIKKFFFDHWDEMRSNGEYPTIDYSLIGKLGFRKRSIEISDYYTEYIGGESVGEENLLDFLSSQVFHSDDLSFRRQWGDEDLIFTFKLSNVRVDKYIFGDKNIEADVDILEGYINLDEYDEDQDEYTQVRYNISRGNNEIDDMSTYFDVQDEIKTIVQSFIIDFAIKYGTEITDADVDILK
jgi:hypothetical protein